MITANDVVTCLVCADEVAGALLARHDPRCGGAVCTGCVAGIVRMSCEPTVVPAASEGDFEWGQLPAAPACPACRAPFAREWLASLAVLPDDLLEIAFAIDRSENWYRHTGEPWRRVGQDPFVAEVELMPVAEPDLARSVREDTTFMPEVNRLLVHAVDQYHRVLLDVRQEVRVTRVLTQRRIADHVIVFDELTSRIAELCARRAAVVAAVRSAPCDPESVVNVLAALMAACVDAGRCDDHLQLCAASERLMALPCPQVPVADLEPLAGALGADSLWFELAAHIRRVDDGMAALWRDLRAQAASWTPEAARAVVVRALADMDELDLMTCLREMVNVHGWTDQVDEENARLAELVDGARGVLGLT
ncbi:hypothetical protein UK23_31085 [Lentzea aerocolonigenes]|uniref:Uncharacterized protein n=1 Tax=Lentzea aerocolonigenes TaxID=68170 RepID=A0A0F0GKE7_LENAE|nr:hypothetical protein [Lentzea aerocolonigenes]KJK43994.1 hypothetical protein UK23_31085 [Lentzea aerocolonigenes]